MLNMVNKTLVRFCLTIVVSFFLLSFAQLSKKDFQEDWQLISQRKVNFLRDKDEIVVNNSNRFTGIRFAARERSIGISEVKIYFSNGDKLEPFIDEIIKKGEQSSVIDLGAEGRTVSKIELKYRTIGNVLKGRADIHVYGRKAVEIAQ